MKRGEMRSQAGDLTGCTKTGRIPCCAFPGLFGFYLSLITLVAQAGCLCLTVVALPIQFLDQMMRGHGEERFKVGGKRRP